MQDKRSEYSKFPKGNPFGVPEGYFDMLDDRIKGRIKTHIQRRTPMRRVIDMAKPLLGLAAGFILILLVVKYPIGRMTFFMNKQETAVNVQMIEDDLLWVPGFIDEKTFFQLMTSTVNNGDNVGSDEVIAIISSGISDYDIYAEIIK